MTWTECRDALLQYDRRVYLLAVVSQIAGPVLSRCGDEARQVSERALDATRRWCLGEATAEECREAAADDAAYAADDAAYAAAYAAYADAYAAYADATRARLIESLADAPRQWQDAVVADGNVRTATHVWWREGRFGGKWRRLTDADAVKFDAVLEKGT